MGWAMLLLLLAASAAALWLLGVRSGLFKAAAAALLVGASGYALQGSPSLPDAPAPSAHAAAVLPLTEVRHAFFGRFSPAESWLTMSEALARDGRGSDSIGILQNAVKRYPGDPQLWVGLGNALVDHGHGLTPPAEFAYQRAAALAPGHPAPRFFHDLALTRSGQSDAALKDLAALYRDNPDASWRPMVGELIMAMVMRGQRRPQR